MFLQFTVDQSIRPNTPGQVEDIPGSPIKRRASFSLDSPSSTAYIQAETAARSAEAKRPKSPTEKMLANFQKHVLENVVLVSILIYFGWVAIGVIFYTVHNKFTPSTSFFYALEAGLSIGFCNPQEVDDNSRIFTIFYVIFASTIVSGSLGYCLRYLTMTKNAAVGYKHELNDVSIYKNGKITLHSAAAYYWYRIKWYCGWYSHYRNQIFGSLLFLFWMAIGTMYGVLLEHWSVITSLYWAVTTVSTGGLQSPSCIHGTSGGTCQFGDMRALMMGFFMLIGVPIYAFAMGQFSMFGIAYAANIIEKKQLENLINDEDFAFAANILSEPGSTTVNLGEFILLELMRIGSTNTLQIELIKEKFAKLDTQNDGVLTMDELKSNGEGKKHHNGRRRRLDSASKSLSSEVSRLVGRRHSTMITDRADIELAILAAKKGHEHDAGEPERERYLDLVSDEDNNDTSVFVDRDFTLDDLSRTTPPIVFDDDVRTTPPIRDDDSYVTPSLFDDFDFNVDDPDV